MKNLLTLIDLSDDDLRTVIDLAGDMKKNPDGYAQDLSGKTLGLVFQKPSNRTRVSFAVGMMQLGGQDIYLGPEELKIGKRESVKDVAVVLSRYLDGIVYRTFGHESLIEMAKYATVPIINGLSDSYHPCQALADIFTIYEKKNLGECKVVYVGDGNNVLSSLMIACKRYGVHLTASTPRDYAPSETVIKQAQDLAGEGEIIIEEDPYKAVSEADVIYTDVWTSMGQETERAKRQQDFDAYQVNGTLVSKAKKDCIVMHCLPAYRGLEITDEVIDGKHSAVYDQAENRLYVQKAILHMLLKQETK